MRFVHPYNEKTEGGSLLRYNRVSMSKQIGKVIKLAGLNVWPHEQYMADHLANAGHVVEFIRPSDTKYQSTPDVLIDGVRREMKSPRASSLKAVRRNLKLGGWQSSKIIFTARRMKGIPDKAVQRELSSQLADLPKIVAIKFINRHGEIVDIC